MDTVCTTPGIFASQNSGPLLGKLVHAHIFVLQEWRAKEGCEKVIENYFEVNGVGNQV